MSWEFLEENFSSWFIKTTAFYRNVSILTAFPTYRTALGFWQWETSLTGSQNIWIGIPKVPGDSFHHYYMSSGGSLFLKYLFLIQRKDVFAISSICGMGKLSGIFRFYPELLFLQGYFFWSITLLVLDIFLVKTKSRWRRLVFLFFWRK